MQFIANYEIKSAVSIFEDGKWVVLQHPKGKFRARICNIVRKDFRVPFLLSLQLTFDAEKLEVAKDIADEVLADCLNMLALTTGSSFVRHRVRQIVDCTSDTQMRSCLMWGDSIGHEDPSPFIDDEIIASINQLLTFDMPPAVSRALRWYRIGISSSTPDDQFQYFWFALELIANFQKSSEKVPDQCPHCKSPLYCELCKTHPQHKPYIKQAIQSLIKAVDKDCDDATIKVLGDARNSLMHGTTLKEIEEKLPEPHEDIVDILGKIVFKALINQIPQEVLTDKVVFGSPSTYVHRSLTGVAHIKTVVPIDADGEFDLSFSSMTMEMVTDAPPQSARPTLMVMTLEQYSRLRNLSFTKGDHQKMCQRISQRTETHGEQVVALVLSTDRALILEAIKNNESGEWQDLFREIIGTIHKSQ